MRNFPTLAIAASALALGGVAIPAAARDGGTPATAPALQEPAPTASRPNIVVFLADDLGFGDTGAYGDPNASTPALDRFVASGIAFNQAFVASPACSPSRAALLTGLMPARNGAEANQSAPRADTAAPHRQGKRSARAVRVRARARHPVGELGEGVRNDVVVRPETPSL